MLSAVYRGEKFRCRKDGFRLLQGEMSVNMLGGFCEGMETAAYAEYAAAYGAMDVFRQFHWR